MLAFVVNVEQKARMGVGDWRNCRRQLSCAQEVTAASISEVEGDKDSVSGRGETVTSEADW